MRSVTSMLFHITHRHTAANCPYHDKQTIEDTYAKAFKNATDGVGGKLVALLVDAPAHTMYFIVDAPSVEALEAMLDPIVDRGEADIRPVSDAQELIARRRANL